MKEVTFVRAVFKVADNGGQYETCRFETQIYKLKIK